MTTTSVISLNRLTLDPRNARLHSQANIDAIKASLSEFGLQKPIVINKNNVVLAGNGTVRAARELGWETITVIEFEGSEEEERAFAIADNRSAELGAWDQTGLAELLTSLDDGLLAAAGYTPMTVDDLLASIQESQDITLPPIDERFQSLATRSMILTYPRAEYDLVVTLFAAVRARYGFDSNSETLAHLLDILVGEPA
jgi:hypothetical protein